MTGRRLQPGPDHEERRKRYNAAYWSSRAAIGERVRAAAALGQARGDGLAYLDIVRLVLQREVDEAVNAAIAALIVPAQVARDTSGCRDGSCSGSQRRSRS